METFSSLFRDARQGTDWSLRKLQGELADSHGIKVSYSFLGAVEKGRRVPSYELACVLAEILGIDVKRAMKAAFSSRMENDQRRESEYIENTIRKRRIPGIQPEDITGGR